MPPTVKRAIWVVAAAGPAAFAALLLGVAVTWRGWFFGLVALALLALPLLPRKKVAAPAVLAAVLALALSAPVIPEWALGRTGVSQLRGGGRWSLFAWLPEADQLALGSFPLQLVDPLLDAAHARRLRSVLPGVHRDLRLVGSMVGAVTDEASGQTFVIVPPHAEGERLPLVVYLHGSGGPLIAYQALLERWAVEGHFIIVSPAFGIGNWQGEGGVAAIETARTFAEASLPVDASRVALVGLSNGGRGITRAVARDDARRWPTVIALSAVIEVGVLTDAWKDRDVLLLHGEDDERIPLEAFAHFSHALEERGAHVTQKTWPGEDHFLWFAQGPAVQSAAVGWLKDRWR